jgi:hypothetical protein
LDRWYASMPQSLGQGSQANVEAADRGPLDCLRGILAGDPTLDKANAGTSAVVCRDKLGRWYRFSSGGEDVAIWGHFELLQQWLPGGFRRPRPAWTQGCSREQLAQGTPLPEC